MATTNSYTIHQFWCSRFCFVFFDSCWYDSCHNTIEQNCFEWSKRQLSATRSILWKKTKELFGPSTCHAPKKKKTVFEPTEIQTITLYLTVSSFTTVVFLIELELLTPVWLTFTVSALSLMHVNFVWIFVCLLCYSLAVCSNYDSSTYKVMSIVMFPKEQAQFS